jgi:hypothetical protein
MVMQISVEVNGKRQARLSGRPRRCQLLPSSKPAILRVFYSGTDRERGHWDKSLADLWISTLCRILIGIRKYHHGGAILISDSPSGLNATRNTVLSGCIRASGWVGGLLGFGAVALCPASGRESY